MRRRETLQCVRAISGGFRPIVPSDCVADRVPLGRILLNSVIVTTVGSVIKVVLAITSAYALVFIRVRFKNVIFLGILVGVMWIIEGVVSLSTLSDSRSKGWTIFFAILSIVAGIVLLFSPLWGALVLWWVLGISLVILGIVQIIRAFTFSPLDA